MFAAGYSLNFVTATIAAPVRSPSVRCPQLIKFQAELEVRPAAHGAVCAQDEARRPALEPEIRRGPAQQRRRAGGARDDDAR